MTSYQKDFIANLKYYRAQKGYSQATLAEYCNCQPGTIGCIESARQCPSFELLFKISEVLNVNPADFFIRDASKITAHSREILEERLIPEIQEFINQNFPAGCT